MRELVLAVERAYVTPPSTTALGDPEIAAACIGAVASRFLAVGTPRSIGLIGPPHLAQSSLEAHRTWFDPKDVRTADRCSIDEILASDIVCIHAPIAIGAKSIRRGTHINVLVAGVTIDPDLAVVRTDEVTGLRDLAAGFVDGRQLDEITVFVIGDAAIARAAII